MKFGQHFLIDEDVLETMVHLVDEYGSKDTLLEIGPGQGVLTKELAQLAQRVIAVEIDRQFIPILEPIKRKNINIELIFEDILCLQREQLGLTTGQYSVASNLPYEITSAFLRQFLTQPPYPNHMALLIQKEVAERLVAKPGKLSILGISVQAYCQPRYICAVPPSAFRPRPKVDSAIVSLEQIRSTNPFSSSAHEQAFFRLVKGGFAQKRKLLSSNLKNISYHDRLLPPMAIAEAFFDLKIPVTARAQELSLDQWYAMVDKLEKFIV